MKIYPDSKIYIFCPGNLHTGGPESLHQLASKLISLGFSVYMNYYSIVTTNFDKNDPVHDLFRKYHVPYTFQIKDDPRNVVIISETATEYLYRLKNCQRILWWMSIDNYFIHIIENFQFYLENPLSRSIMKTFSFDTADKNIEHWSQSEYVHQFLKLNGVTEIKNVETNMSHEFLSPAAQIDLSKKKNFVTYNPKKGFEITEQLISFAPDLDWRPINNMTPAQVRELLAEAKIYIDFGKFPGRERLPREAILSGCVVITGKRGAAANDVDINIPDEFKFDEKTTVADDVVEKIREVLENFEANYNKQKEFRYKELSARSKFTAQITKIFDIKNLPPPSVALTQGVGEESFLLAQEILLSEDFKLNFIVDDVLATTKLSDELILREQNRNYLRVGKNLIEIITRDDAKFLYWEGRIKKFALLEPSEEELVELRDFYKPSVEDVLIFER